MLYKERATTIKMSDFSNHYVMTAKLIIIFLNQFTLLALESLHADTNLAGHYS